MIVGNFEYYAEKYALTSRNFRSLRNMILDSTGTKIPLGTFSKNLSVSRDWWRHHYGQTKIFDELGQNKPTTWNSIETGAKLTKEVYP